jgi:hypothetical protein
MTSAILSQIQDTLLGVRGAAAQLAQIAAQILELATPLAPESNDSRVKSQGVQANAQRVALAACSLAAHAGRLEAFAAALVLEREELERRSVVASDVVTSQAFSDATLFMEDERDNPETCPDVDTWARDAFNESWKDWQYSLGLLSSDALRIYLDAFAAAIRGGS